MAKLTYKNIFASALFLIILNCSSFAADEKEQTNNNHDKRTLRITSDSLSNPYTSMDFESNPHLFAEVLQKAVTSSRPLFNLMELKICFQNKAQNDFKGSLTPKITSNPFKSFELQCDQAIYERFAPAVLIGDMGSFKALKGENLVERLRPHYNWKMSIQNAGLWFFEKASVTVPGRYCVGVDKNNTKIEGINFASQDYLSLLSHPYIKESAIRAINIYGVHSAGSCAVLGNTNLTLELEQTISQFLGMKYTALYPTGWGAGFGIIKALVRPQDHIVMDHLTHASLQEGAFSATANVSRCQHLVNTDFAQKLEEIRSKDKENAILVITESLYSMDSDSPYLPELQDVCRRYNATLLVDMAHDLGCLGENGGGLLETQNMIGKIDIIMGSFSKTFASNGGFIATDSREIKEYLTFFSGPRTFSNALSPIQTAIVLAAFKIVQSEEGKMRRRKLMENVTYVRQKLAEHSFTVKGGPSAIVPLVIGDEGLARITNKLLTERGIITNNIEFPVVPKGTARLRIQVMADHTKEDMQALVEEYISCLQMARKVFDIIQESQIRKGPSLAKL